MKTQSIVETIDLSKSYGDIIAVDKLNLHINDGDIFGFLGPNGAGKTTTILMLLGLTEPTSGTALVSGYNTTREPLKVKRITGYIPEKVGFYEDLTASYNLFYTARLNEIPDKEANKRIAAALDIVGLGKDGERHVGEFSRGMRQRLAIAEILVKRPQIAIMDEPTSGIDPEGISQVLDMIKTIAREQKMTIIMCSHQLSQVQRICNRVGILMKGRLLAEGNIEELGRKSLGAGKFRIEVKLTEVTTPIVEAVKRIKGVITVDRSEEQLIISCAEDLRPKIAKAIIDANGMLVEIKIQAFALEDIYLKYFREA